MKKRYVGAGRGERWWSEQSEEKRTESPFSMLGLKDRKEI